jgi:hypothetical protein
MTLDQILIAGGAVLTTWIFNNVRLREGVTDWFVKLIGREKYEIKDHTVIPTLKALKFESKLTEYDNKLKTELFQFYIEVVLNTMNELVEKILADETKLSLEDTKKLIKNTMYDKLLYINTELDTKIKMPDVLQTKFDRFTNYLNMQHTYAIENALQATSKKILLIQVFDAIETNSRWFLFYNTEMFDNFNGHFDTITRRDVFKLR